MQKVFAWIVFISVTLCTLLSSLLFHAAYNLFSPYSNIDYLRETDFWKWKFWLILALVTFGVSLTHLTLGGRALVDGDIRKTINISLITLIGLILLYLISYQLIYN